MDLSWVLPNTALATSAGKARIFRWGTYGETVGFTPNEKQSHKSPKGELIVPHQWWVGHDWLCWQAFSLTLVVLSNKPLRSPHPKKNIPLHARFSVPLSSYSSSSIYPFLVILSAIKLRGIDCPHYLPLQNYVQDKFWTRFLSLRFLPTKQRPDFNLHLSMFSMDGDRRD